MTNENLVSIETKTERSLTDGKSETQIFLKMYVSAVKHGLLADMGDSNWRTLCVIASFMDEDGNCYPTQSQIAKGLGVSRQAAGRRVRKLLEYRWQGRPLVTAIQDRHEGRFDNTRYTVLPISQIRIFDAEPEEL
ncbi:Helix-turn-helix domain-containing protein [Oceanobacillus limi]|uniref:Helix-turn-helix domain-containing protein n=1 Tax=Oceanobacillus limi TaxID=930131 RepID=A0A1I0EE49_9BACI|nr:helix-turn-helix domain-containing protein [Oceanobacillus limi]SET43323.1 Helix-turn-helix domain-containing protein [Oceanobacillus limi]